MSHMSYTALWVFRIRESIQCKECMTMATVSQQLIPVKNMLQPTMGMKKLDVLDTNLNGRFR